IALDRKVAIKVMAPALFSTAGMVERFKREARTAAALSHPHIIPIYAVRESADLVYFVMKFVEGRSLESIVRAAGPLPLPLVRAVLYQAGDALGYAHRRGVVHRDVKPANIMLDTDGWVVVTDFESAVAALGGAPLTREDPIRAQLAALGRAKADADVRRLATPVSPLPATRSPKPKTTRAAPAAPRRVPVVAWALPVVALAAAAVWWVVTHSARDGRPVTPPIAAAPAAETTTAHATATPLAAAKPPRPAGERF